MASAAPASTLTTAPEARQGAALPRRTARSGTQPKGATLDDVWKRYRPLLRHHITACTGRIDQLRWAIEHQSNPITTGHLDAHGPIFDAHLLRAFARALHADIIEVELRRGLCGHTERTMHGSPACSLPERHNGRHLVTPPRVEAALAEARSLSAEASKLEHEISWLALSTRRDRVDGVPVDAFARDELRTVPLRLIWLAERATALAEQLEIVRDVGIRFDRRDRQ